MSAFVENTHEELEVLQAATILKVSVGPRTIRLYVDYADGTVVNGSAMGVYEIWQDGEGNGPGYLALVGGREAFPLISGHTT